MTLKLSNNINDLWRDWTWIKNYAESESPYTALATQSANRVFAAPNGSNGTPSYRLLVANDIPNLDTSKFTSGSFNASLIGSGVMDNARINWASPSAIGGTVPSTGEFQDLRATNYHGYTFGLNIGSPHNLVTTVLQSIGAPAIINLPSLASLYIAYSSTSGEAPMIFIRNAGIGTATLTPAGGEDIDGAATLVLASGTHAMLAGISTTRWRRYL